MEKRRNYIAKDPEDGVCVILLDLDEALAALQEVFIAEMI
jgi:hypothetical protein